MTLKYSLKSLEFIKNENNITLKLSTRSKKIKVLLDFNFLDLIEYYLQNHRKCCGFCIITSDQKLFFIIFNNNFRLLLVYNEKNKTLFETTFNFIKNIFHNETRIKCNVLPLMEFKNNKMLPISLKYSHSLHSIYGFLYENQYYILQNPIWNQEKASIVLSDPLMLINKQATASPKYWLYNFIVKFNESNKFIVHVCDNNNFLEKSFVYDKKISIFHLSYTQNFSHLENSRAIQSCWIYPYLMISSTQNIILKQNHQINRETCNHYNEKSIVFKNF